MFSSPAEERFKTGLQGLNAMRTKTIVASEATISYETLSDTLSHRSRSRSLRALPGQFAQMRRRVQTSPATLRAAQTRSIVLAIKKVVVVSQFLARPNIAQRNDPHLALDLIGFAVRRTGMIHECRNAIPINDFLAAIQTK